MPSDYRNPIHLKSPRSRWINKLWTLRWHHNELDGVSNHQPHDCLLVYSGADQSKHQSSVSLAFVRGIHRGPGKSPHKWPVPWKMFPFDDVIIEKMSLFVVSSATADGLVPSCGGTRHIIIKVWIMYNYQTGTLIANQLTISRVYFIYMYSN